MPREMPDIGIYHVTIVLLRLAEYGWMDLATSLLTDQGMQPFLYYTTSLPRELQEEK